MGHDKKLLLQKPLPEGGCCVLGPALRDKVLAGISGIKEGCRSSHEALQKGEAATHRLSRVMVFPIGKRRYIYNALFSSLTYFYY
jgi:hypothetical protein